MDRSHNDFVIRRAELTASVTGLTNGAHSTRSVLPASVPCVHDPRSISLVHGANIVTSVYDFATSNREYHVGILRRVLIVSVSLICINRAVSIQRANI